jgi:hypothetical protein
MGREGGEEEIKREREDEDSWRWIEELNGVEEEEKMF